MPPDGRRLQLGALSWSLTAGFVFAVACHNAGDDALMARAPSDMSCPAASLSMRTLADSLAHGKTVAVEGCGRRQVYVRVCSDSVLWMSNCVWLRDGPPSDAGDARDARDGGKARD